MVVNPIKKLKEKVTRRWRKRREREKWHNVMQIPEGDREDNLRIEVESSASVTNYSGAAP